MTRYLKYVAFSDIESYQKKAWAVVPRGAGEGHPVLDTRGVMMVKYCDCELEDPEC